jgi:DNA-binding MarR family transcriptional regulator
MENQGVTQKELAGNMWITPPSMSVNLQKMESSGLLIRKPDDTDLRQIRLYLTEKGAAMAEQTEKELALANERLLETLTLKEQKEFKRLLIKILKSMRDGRK